MKDLPYKMEFTSQANFVIEKKEEQQVAFASLLAGDNDLSSLKALLPSQDEIEENGDVLFFSANLAVANQINLNGDGVLTDGMISLAKTMKYKQINVEHSRPDNICGVIIGTAFTEFGTNKILTEEEVRGMRTPFNLAITGCLWKVAGDVWEVVEASSRPDSEHFQAVSLSWEIFFSCAAMADDKDLSKANLKFGKEALSLKKFLKAEKGPGFGPDGKPVYRVALDPLGGGAGLVLQPAASVAGLVTPETFAEPVEEKEETEEDESSEASVDPEVQEPVVTIMQTEEEKKLAFATRISAASGRSVEDIITYLDTHYRQESIIAHEAAINAHEKAVVALVEVSGGDADKVEADLVAIAQAFTAESLASLKNIEENEKIISILEEPPVIKIRPMKFNSKEEVFAHMESVASVDAKAMREFLEAAILEANDKYVEEQTLKAAAEKQLQESLANADKTMSELNEIKTKLSEMEASIRDKEIQEAFDARMTALSADFNIDEPKVRSVIAKHIRDLDQEGYDFWVENDGQVLLAGYKKEVAAIDPDDATKALQEATASVDLPGATNPADAPVPNLFDLSKEISFKSKH